MLSFPSNAHQSSYGAYEGQQAEVHQEYETTYTQEQRDGGSGKIPAPRRDMRNMYRLTLAIMSMLMLIPFALLFVVFVGGSQGWICFGIAAAAIFLISVVAIDKIQ